MPEIAPRLLVELVKFTPGRLPQDPCAARMTDAVLLDAEAAVSLVQEPLSSSLACGHNPQHLPRENVVELRVDAGKAVQDGHEALTMHRCRHLHVSYRNGAWWIKNEGHKCEVQVRQWGRAEGTWIGPNAELRLHGARNALLLSEGADVAVLLTDLTALVADRAARSGRLDLEAGVDGIDAEEGDAARQYVARRQPLPHPLSGQQELAFVSGFREYAAWPPLRTPIIPTWAKVVERTPYLCGRLAALGDVSRKRNDFTTDNMTRPVGNARRALGLATGSDYSAYVKLLEIRSLVLEDWHRWVKNSADKTMPVSTFFDVPPVRLEHYRRPLFVPSLTPAQQVLDAPEANHPTRKHWRRPAD